MAAGPRGLVLCGPPCVGKTETGVLVAQTHGWSFDDADREQASWLLGLGWGSDTFSQRVGEVGRQRAYLEYEILLADYLAAVLSEHPTGVIALGAGHAHAAGAEASERIVATLRADPRPVVRLLPDPDPAVSCAVVRARVSARGDDTYRRPGRDLISEWIGSPVMTLASDHTLYTGEDGPTAVAASLARFLADLPGGGRCGAGAAGR